MKNKNYRVSRATLYNTIELLLECKLIRKHQFEKAQAQFEKSFLSRQHDHIICTTCDKVIEFCDPRILNIKNSIIESMNFQIEKHCSYSISQSNTITYVFAATFEPPHFDCCKFVTKVVQKKSIGHMMCHVCVLSNLLTCAMEFFQTR